MTYQPLLAELAPDERRFLALVSPLGVDWVTTRNELAARVGGITRFANWADVIALPPSTALSDVPLAFMAYAEHAPMDLPPEYLFTHFMPHLTARRNHRDPVRGQRAGLGRRGRSSPVPVLGPAPLARDDRRRLTAVGF